MKACIPDAGITLMFVTGTLKYRVPDRYWAGDRFDYPALETSVEINGQDDTTDANGMFT